MILDHEVPLIEIFPKIKNREVFLKKSHPKISPELEYSKYVSYWREEKRRCIEGFWGEEEENSWRYASPDIYFYANHWLITEQRDDGTEVTVRPSLRQSDWHFFCTWLVCRKFSGFMDDDEYNGHYLLKKYWDNSGELDETDQHRLDKAKYVKNHKGEYKKYRDPYEILADTYSYPLGLPCYENPAQDMMCMSSRGIGKSFWASSIAAREFTFNGARYYNRKDGEHENEVEISQESGKVFCSSYEEKYVDLLYAKIFSGLDNFSGEYKTMEKAYPPPFYKWRQGTFGGNSNVVTHAYTVRYPIGGKRTKGSRSAMYKGVYSNGINQAIGNRVNIGIIDEAGLILNLKEVHGANRNVMERGGVKAGSLLYTGTGGDVTKIEGSKSMFYNPKQNRLYSMPNKWEDTDEISMFIPAEYSLKEFWDENGNTNLELARKELLKRRKIAAEGNDSIQYNMERMYMPLKPSDIFLVDGGLIFLQDKIMSRLSDISRLDNWRQDASFGEIKCFGNKFDDVQIRRGRFENERPIISRSLGEMDNTRGCIIFYKEPEGNDTFRMKGSRYRITYDPVRREGSEVNRYRSLASIIVWDTKERQIAAEFIGRRDTPEEIHDICLNLAIYYNCPILAETNVSGFKNAAKKRGLAFMLYPTPIEALSKKVAGLKYSPGDVGVEMTGKIKPAAIEFAQDFMNRKDENGICLYDTLNSLRLLEEMEVWDGESNSDHISAFLLLAIWEEEEREGVIMQPANPQSKYTEFKKIMAEQRLSRQIYSAMYRT